MKKMLLAAAAAIVVFGTPALAYDAMKSNAMDATMMCRPATAAEKPAAMMGSKGMVCKSMAGAMGTMPKGNTATDKQWRAWIEQAMMIPLSGNG
jgi:hypothetical protein